MFEVEIAAGAEWLDGFKPGWEREIEPATLELQSPCRCILGQVFHDEAVQSAVDANIENDTEEELELDGFNGFDWVLENQGHTFSPWAHRHGFTVISYGGYAVYQEAWKQLETEWIDFVKDRFSRGALSG